MPRSPEAVRCLAVEGALCSMSLQPGANSGVAHLITSQGTTSMATYTRQRLQAERKAVAKAEIAKEESVRRRDGKGKIVDQTIDEAFDEYWMEVGQHSSGAADIKTDLACIIGHLGPHMMLSDIDTEIIVKMRDQRRQEARKWRTRDGKPPNDPIPKKSKAPRTISARSVDITVGERLKWPLSHMAAEGRQIQPINWDKVWINEQPRHTEFTPAHERLMRDTYRKDHLPALAFALLAGPRRHQLTSMKWSDIDWERRTIRFRPAKKSDARRTARAVLDPDHPRDRKAAPRPDRSQDRQTIPSRDGLNLRRRAHLYQPASGRTAVRQGRALRSELRGNRFRVGEVAEISRGSGLSALPQLSAV